MALEGYINANPLLDETRVAILKSVWTQASTSVTPDLIREWDAYFEHYTSECRRALQWGNGAFTTVRKHADIVSIAKELGSDCTKRKIVTRLMTLDTQQRNKDIRKRMAEGSLRLVARLYMMIDIGPICPDDILGPTPLSWSDEASTITSVVGKYFQRNSSSPSSSVRKLKFEADFTAYNLQRFAGLKIVWTNNLVNHLRLFEDDTELHVFHQITFLKHQSGSVYSKAFVEETIRTLALLFPRNDKATKKWLTSDKSTNEETICIDMGLLKCNRMLSTDRRAEKFDYWRDELLTLKELFDRPKPTSIKHFWYDRRNKVQWYTFWIAVLILCLTIFFGFVQSIEGALQVYKAYHPTPG